MPDLKWNQDVWNRDYAWPADGDEWNEFAQACGVPYEAWKESLARAYLIPNFRETSTVLEIGPGHGRWSAFIAPRTTKGTLHLVELSRNCIEFCKKRFAQYPHVKTWVNNGISLEKIETGSVDFIWSFDTFVHIEEDELRAYAKEFRRVLKTHGMGVIHHVGDPTPEQRRNGARSQVNATKFRNILWAQPLHVIEQVDHWKGGDVKLTGDILTHFVKP